MGSLTQLKKRLEDQKAIRIVNSTEGDKITGVLQKQTSITLQPTSSIILPQSVVQPLRSDPEAPSRLIVPRSIRTKRGQVFQPITAALDGELPMGYHALGRHDVDKLMKLKEKIIETGICAFDYESDGDPDDEAQDPQDHKLVSVSFAYQIGQAFCTPIAHDFYAANWDKDWFIENFLKPILEHPNVLIIAQNVKFEHSMSICLGIDMFPKACAGKVMDTMIMIKALALPENMVQMGEDWEVQLGLKPATKALLADANGMVHGLLHIDQIKSFKETVGRLEWEEPIPGEFYKSGVKKGLPKTKKMSRSRTFNELPVDQETVDYGCSDSDWALGIYYKLLPMCHSEGVYDVIVELDVPRMMVLAEYELAGWKINPEELKKLGYIADEALAKLAPLLQEGLLEVTGGYAATDDDGNVLVPVGTYPMGKWRKDPVELTIKNSKPFSWGSTQHLQWLFFHVLGASSRDVERSKTTGLPSMGEASLDKLLDEYASSGGNKFMDVLKEKRKYDKIKSTYVGKWNEENQEYTSGMLQFCREDSQKIHTNLRLVSTWRLASKKPNLQNIPRPENDPMGIRGTFEAPTYDLSIDYGLFNPLTKPVQFIIEHKLSGITVWVGADYAQIVLKVLAVYTGEESMIRTLVNGGDIHARTAIDVFRLNCTEDEVKILYKPFRYSAKAVNFGLVYGLTEYGLAKDPKMNMTVEQAKVFVEQYMQRYPGVRAYMHSMIDFARKHGYVETMFKHRRALPRINHPNKWVRQSEENKSINTPIQGSAADIMGLAMVNVRKDAPKWLKPVIQIHDELMCECPIEHAVEGSIILKEIMEREIEGFSEIMPLLAEPSVGKIWRHALDIKWDDKGTPYVKPKRERKELSDVTFSDIEYMMPLYQMAGIEVRG